MGMHSYTCQGNTKAEHQTAYQGMAEYLTSLHEIVGSDEMSHLHREMVAAALSKLPMSQLVDSISPMLAEASAPRCPTMDASMKNIITVEICASMEGILNPTMRLSFSLRAIALPSRIDSIR